MENNDSNIKSQQTGGLKLMTVFIAVLALHVVVIGGFTAYNLMKGGSADADLVTTDKTHKDLKSASGPAIADGASADAGQGEKSAPAPAPSTDAATTPANPAPPAPDQAATATPAPATVTTTTAPALAPPPIDVTDQGTQTGPIASDLAPPPEPAQTQEPAPAPLAPVPAPTASMASGPVHMPAVAPPAPASRRIYVVKITDSYKKIAHAHHITVAELKEANHIKGDMLHTGQKLIIPSAKTLVATTAPAPAPEAFSPEPVAADSAPAPAASLASAPPAEAAPVSHHHLYTVMKGDTLVKIAHKFKTTPAALMSENSITDPTKLAIGKKLRIPSGETRSARNGAPASTQPGQVQAKENAPSAQLANFVP